MHTPILIISAFLVLLCVGNSQAWYRPSKTYRTGSVSRTRQPAKKTIASHHSPWYPHTATPQPSTLTTSSYASGEACQLIQALLHKLQCQKSQTQGSDWKSWIHRVRCWRVKFLIAQLAGRLESPCNVEDYHETDQVNGSVLCNHTTTPTTTTTMTISVKTDEQTTPVATSALPTATTPTAELSSITTTKNITETATTTAEPTPTTQTKTPPPITTTTTSEPALTTTESSTTTPESTPTTETTTTTTTATTSESATSTAADTTTTTKGEATTTTTTMTTKMTTSQSTTSEDDEDNETVTDVPNETTTAATTCVSHGGTCVEDSVCGSDAVPVLFFTCPSSNDGCCLVVPH